MYSVSSELRDLADKYEKLVKQTPIQHYAYLVTLVSKRQEWQEEIFEAMKEAMVAGNAYEEKSGKILPWMMKARGAVAKKIQAEEYERNPKLY